MKKTRNICVTLTIIVLCLFCIYKITDIDFLKNEDNIDSLSDIQYTNEIINPDIILYGDTNPFHEQLDYREISSLNKDEIMKDTEEFMKVLVIVDINEEKDISVEQLLMIKELVEKNGIDMLYYGERHLDTFRQYGFVMDDYYEDVRSFAYVGSFFKEQTFDMEEWSGNPYALHNDWDIYDEEQLKENKWSLEKDILVMISMFANDYVDNFNDWKENMRR